MTRHKSPVHLALAVALVLLAAIVGQVRRWDWRSETAPQPDAQEVAPAGADESESAESEQEAGAEEECGPAHAEVLVRFGAGTTEERIAADAARLHGRVEDEIESVDGLVAIEDLNGETAAEVESDDAPLPQADA